jgi:pyruvate kinase
VIEQPNKTKIVCTIGPASDSEETLRQLVLAGMNVARLNFSHGDFDFHRSTVKRIRAVSRATGRRIAIMGDLPGPKMRIGELAEEPLELQPEARLTLTTEEILGTRERIGVSFSGLPSAVAPGDTLFLNDGFIQLKVLEVSGSEVHCRIQVGGELRSRKGLNLPGIDLGISAFTDADRAWLAFAADCGIDAVSQSFVADATDVMAVRQAAEAIDYRPFIIAKIERATALDHLEAILDTADGIMVARGDLGVEIPIEQIAVTQKAIMDQANLKGKPVITATQMLESMVSYRRPTRAEATDVANAILDGTDCVMLSAESAMGRYPVEAVAMLARIAAYTEPNRSDHRVKKALETSGENTAVSVVDLIALSVYHTVKRIRPATIIVPTRGGNSARSITRFRLPAWVTAFSPEASTCQALQFSYGINPVKVDQDRPDWNQFARHWLAEQGVKAGLALLTQGPSPQNLCGNHRMEILELDAEQAIPCATTG